MRAQTIDIRSFDSYLSRHAVRLSESQIRLLDLFLNELLEWNKSFNLVGLRSRHQVVRHLVLDSLICAAQLPEKGQLLDVGSGSGFPALPIKIYRPDLDLVLLEPNRKKASFLKHLKRTLSLEGFRVLRERLEAHVRSSKHPYHCVTSRAAMPAQKLLSSCAPILAPGGLIFLFLGKDAKVILERSSKEIAQARLAIYRLQAYQLPAMAQPRFIAILKKTTDEALTSSMPS